MISAHELYIAGVSSRLPLPLHLSRRSMEVAGEAWMVWQRGVLVV